MVSLVANSQNPIPSHIKIQDIEKELIRSKDKNITPLEFKVYILFIQIIISNIIINYYISRLKICS